MKSLTRPTPPRPRLRLVVDNTRPEIIIGPTLIGGLGGDVCRLVRRPDSKKFIVEWWPRPGAGWTEAPAGAFKPSEIFMGEDNDGWTPPLPVSFARAAGLGIPHDELRLGAWERSG
jgi:hypothetical protein